MQLILAKSIWFNFFKSLLQLNNYRLTSFNGSHHLTIFNLGFIYNIIIYYLPTDNFTL